MLPKVWLIERSCPNQDRTIKNFESLNRTDTKNGRLHSSMSLSKVELTFGFSSKPLAFTILGTRLTDFVSLIYAS